MTINLERNIRGRWLAAAAALTVLAAPHTALADEGGVSFWLPGTYGSLAATPQVPGWAMANIYYHTSVSADGRVAAARQFTIGRFSRTLKISLEASLDAQADLGLIAPSYVFETPVFGGQLALSMISIVGRNKATVDGTLTAQLGQLSATRQGQIEGSVTGFGDLYPKAELRWNAGVNNFMTYVTGDIPVGAYDPHRLANLGIGHAAIDGGVGYTYFDPSKGHEFSAVAGLTYNFENPDTDYRNGVDFHLDWAASQFLSKQFMVGVVGYTYQQITDDHGAPAILGGFRSRVSAVGPQMGFLFPAGHMQGYLNLKGYWEFDAADRPDGWNTWVTLSLSPPQPGAPPPAPSRRLPLK